MLKPSDITETASLRDNSSLEGEPSSRRIVPESDAKSGADASRLQHPDLDAPSVAPASPVWQHGWPVPSSICPEADRARACIYLPEFDPVTLERARVYADRYPLAEARYRSARGVGTCEPEVPHFEKVFRIAAELAGCPAVQAQVDYDELLILTAWYSVRRRTAGYLGSYPKSLLCPLSHAAPPIALQSLSGAQRALFDRRAPFYLRFLLCEKFGLRTCADIENSDLRHLLRGAGFRLIHAGAVPETTFAGITLGEDPPVRPWKLTLRHELSDEFAVVMFLQAALWLVKYGLRLVSFESGQPRWNIGAFARTDWEAAFLGLGARVPPSFTRDSGLLDWRVVLSRCLDQIGTGNLPPEVVGKVLVLPRRVVHDSHHAIWDVTDRAAQNVLEQARAAEPRLFGEGGELNYEIARAFRRWARLFDEVSPNILSRFGVSAFVPLRRVAPQYFGWGPNQLKPWELEQEFGKWRGPRGRALLRSAYAFALYEAGLGSIIGGDDQAVWRCTEQEFSGWSAHNPQAGADAYKFLDAVVLTHGHLDHTGRLPLLAKAGYSGPIYATPATIPMTALILRDSAKLQEQDNQRQNRKRERAGEPALDPLYSPADAELAIGLLKPVEYHRRIPISPGIEAFFAEAGHMLGSASIQFFVRENGQERKIVFSGDLGPRNAPILRDYEPFSHADLVILESTYGDHDHRPFADTVQEFVRIVKECVAAGGKILVPTFAVGRAQVLTMLLAWAFRERIVTPFPVYLDSPMAIEAWKIYRKHVDLFDDEMTKFLREGSLDQDLSTMRLSTTADESKLINDVVGPCLVLAGAGMCTGGRIIHHLRQSLWKPETHVLIVGYQAQGTLGRLLVDRAPRVRIFGEDVAVKAQVHTLGGFSAHAGQTDLVHWLAPLAKSRPVLLLTHGEDDARRELAAVIREKYKLDAKLPRLRETIQFN